MSRAKGNAMPNAFARWLREHTGWAYAEATGAGRNGRDITGTPGVAFELKTADDFKRDFKPTIWMTQARANAGAKDLPVVIYYPRGCGEAHTAESLAILPAGLLIRVLEGAGYVPPRKREDTA